MLEFHHGHILNGLCLMLCASLGLPFAWAESSVLGEAPSRNLRSSSSNPIGGFVVGILLATFIVLYLVAVERKAVRHDVLYKRCKRALCENLKGTFMQELEGKPIFYVGETRVLNPKPETAVDEDTSFTISGELRAIRCKRKVEMFQWKESSKKENGDTAYYYTEAWSEVDEQCPHSTMHSNPTRSPQLYSQVINCTGVRCGEYVLSKEQIEQLHHWKLCPIPKESCSSNAHVEQALKTHCAEEEDYKSLAQESKSDLSDYLVYNGSLASPSIGTVRISYEVVLEGGPVSVIGVQKGRTFRAYTLEDAFEDPHPLFALSLKKSLRDSPNYGSLDAENGMVDTAQVKGAKNCCAVCEEFADQFADNIIGSTVLLIEERHTTANEMFSDEQAKFTKILWISRLCSCLLLGLSFWLIIHPFAVALYFIPLIGWLLANILWLAAFILGIIMATLIIALSWILYRPYILMVLLLATGIPLIFGGSAAYIGGLVLCSVAIVPAFIWAVNLYDDCRFEQKHPAFSALVPK